MKDLDDIPIERELIGVEFEKILHRRISRRTLLKNTAAVSASLVLGSCSNKDSQHTLSFQEIPHGLDEELHLAENYSYQAVLRWGDPLFANEADFNPFQQTAASQARQFGYNNDFVTYLSPAHLGHSSKHGLLVVNHEYTNGAMMHAGSPKLSELNSEQIEVEIYAHGLTIVEVQKQQRNWHVNFKSKLNRRITPYTKMQFSGPAKGHERLKTLFQSSGEETVGTFGNCAGCKTPWGTVLTAEENIQAYFSGQASKTTEHENFQRFGLKGTKTARCTWGKHHERWNINKDPQAALHAGWIVEIDPYTQNSIPIKRTALGRCKHEGCGLHINKDGRVVVYMGDDQAFEYIYRFVSKNKYQAENRLSNRSLLDEGELSVAEFTDHGSLVWHPLVFGQGPHVEKNGFKSQADVVLDLRRAADLVGATPMDRPEEIKVDPVNGNVFALMTNNFKRTEANINPANSRSLNQHGHILELIPPQQNHAAREYNWEVFILAGDPENSLDQAHYHNGTSANGWFSAPDNCSFDKNGYMWIATDGFNRSGQADGIWACAVKDDNKALTKQFLRAPIGAEVCSPCFTPDQKTMFCSIQHPGAGSSFENPSTRWPDFKKDVPPRPSVIAVMHDENKVIGS